MKVFEGVPPPYDRLKRKVVPSALSITRLRPGRKHTTVGRLSADFGWKYQNVVEKLEEKRKLRSAAYYARKKALERVRSKALEVAKTKLSPANAAILQQFGY